MDKLLKIFVYIGIFTILFLGFFHIIYAITQDLGRHLLFGQFILEHGIPRTNTLSYTYPNFPFINSHWLSEILFYFIFKLFGFNGLLLLTAIVATLSFYLIFNLASKNNIFAIFVGSILYLNILFERTDVRPEIFSFLFFCLFLVVLYKYKERFTRWIFLLIPLEAIWVNIHIYFATGILLIIIFLIDSIYVNKKYFLNKHTKTLLVVFVGASLTTLLNPYGLNGALHLLLVFKNYGYPIEENQNIFFLWHIFHKPTIAYFTISALILFITVFTNIKKVKIVDLLLIIVFTTLGILQIRNFPLFVFATFAPFVKNLSTFLDKLFLLFKETPYISPRLEFGLKGSLLVKRAFVACIIFVIIWQVIQVSSLKTIGFGVEAGAKNAADFYLENNLKGPIFNNFDIGSYLEYRLYPKEKVFVDGRPEAYPVSFFQETYIPMQQDYTIFDLTSKQYNFNAIFFAHSDQTPWASSFLKQITNNSLWKMVYIDGYVVIFVKNNRYNQEIIKKFGMDKNSIRISRIDNNNLRSLYRLANFFYNTNLVDEHIRIEQQILALKPDSCPSLYNLLVLLSKKNYPAAFIYQTLYQNSCK